MTGAPLRQPELDNGGTRTPRVPGTPKAEGVAVDLFEPTDSTEHEPETPPARADHEPYAGPGDPEEFDWGSDPDVVYRSRPGIAVYTNGRGDLVIRQQGDFYAFEEDRWVVIDFDQAEDVVAALRRGIEAGAFIRSQAADD